MPDQDTIFIENLKADTKIGTNPGECDNWQPVILDLKIITDISTAAKHDQLNLTINYKTIYEYLLTLINTSRALLLETLAENIATNLLQNFPINQVELKLTKPMALPAKTKVSIMITRHKILN